MSGDEEARARQLALKRAKRAAHDWARAVRSREEDKPDPWARLLAAELADRATLITKEVAEAHALPRECIGTVAAWPGPALLGASVGLHGPHGERYVRRHLKRLKSAGDVVPVDRRHLHQSTVYVLAAAGRPIGATNPDDSDDSDRTQESGRSEGDRTRESGRGGSTGQFGGGRPDNSGGVDRTQESGPLKEEPIIEPCVEPGIARAGAREDTPPPRVGPVRAPPPTDATTAGEWMVAHVADVWPAPVAAGGLGREDALSAADHDACRRAGVAVWDRLRAEVVRAAPKPLGEAAIIERTSRIFLGRKLPGVAPRCVAQWVRELTQGRGWAPTASGPSLERAMPDLLDEVLVEWRAERERLRAAAPASFDGARDGAVLVKQQVRLAPGEGLPATGTSDA